MRLTKLEHACVRLEKDGQALVIDPGAWARADALDGAGAVLVTHEHFDHLDADRLAAADVEIWTNASVAAQLSELGDRVRTVRHGDTFTAAGFDVHVYGAEHAVIHPDIPVIANTGFGVDGAVFHPGDALTVPEDPHEMLLIPGNAPWLKASEMIDYGRAVDPARGLVIHDGLLNELGLMVLNNWLGMAGKDFQRVEPGTVIDL